MKCSIGLALIEWLVINYTQHILQFGKNLTLPADLEIYFFNLELAIELQ